MKSRQEEFTLKILGQLQELFESDCENHIAIEELEDTEAAADFFHVLANVAPAIVYTKLTRNDVSGLDFNHIANRLCFQNSTLVKE